MWLLFLLLLYSFFNFVYHHLHFFSFSFFFSIFCFILDSDRKVLTLNQQNQQSVNNATPLSGGQSIAIAAAVLVKCHKKFVKMCRLKAQREA